MPADCTILHIEDDDLDHALFQRDLEKLEFHGTYVRASSFNRAKDYLQEAIDKGTKPDLIIADSKLGIYNGLDIVRWVKERRELSDTPVVVYSTAISPTQRGEVLTAGAAACLTKPIDSAETMVALQLILSYVDSRCHGRPAAAAAAAST